MRQPQRKRQLEMDQASLDAAKPHPVGPPLPSPRGVEQIIRELRRGPAVITGPELHWCVQALVNGLQRYVYVEILDPVYWKNGPALPREQISVAEGLGFERGQGMWFRRVAMNGPDDLRPAAELMETFIRLAWTADAESNNPSKVKRDRSDEGGQP